MSANTGNHLSVECKTQNLLFAFAKTKAQNSCVVTEHMISAFVFATNSMLPLLPKSEIASFKQFPAVVQLSLCRTWPETSKAGFVVTRPILD